MHVIVNLETLQTEVEDLLFSIRYINEDHQATQLTPEDYTSLKEKFSIVRDHINIYLDDKPSSGSDFEKDLQQNIIDPVITSQKENHKSIACLEIYNSTLQTLLNKQPFNVDNDEVRIHDIIVQSISTAIFVANESLKALELEK